MEGTLRCRNGWGVGGRWSTPGRMVRPWELNAPPSRDRADAVVEEIRWPYGSDTRRPHVVHTAARLMAGVSGEVYAERVLDTILP